MNEKPRELTLAEVEEVVKSLTAPPHAIDIICEDSAMPALGVAKAYDCEPDDLLVFTPSRAAQMIGEAAEKNPFLIGAVQRLAQLGEQVSVPEKQQSK